MKERREDERAGCAAGACTGAQHTGCSDPSSTLCLVRPPFLAGSGAADANDSTAGDQDARDVDDPPTNPEESWFRQLTGIPMASTVPARRRRSGSGERL